MDKVVSQTVIIEVRGGVAEIASNPDNVPVKIIDYDNLDSDEEDMRKEVNKIFPDVKKMSVESAIYYYAGNYHGDQWTNLYIIFYNSKYKPDPAENFDSWKKEDSDGSNIYEYLKKKKYLQ